MVAAATIGLVIDAARNNDRLVTGSPPIVPTPAVATVTSSPSATKATDPGTAPAAHCASTSCCSPVMAPRSSITCAQVVSFGRKRPVRCS